MNLKHKKSEKGGGEGGVCDVHVESSKLQKQLNAVLRKIAGEEGLEATLDQAMHLWIQCEIGLNLTINHYMRKMSVDVGHCILNFFRTF